MTNYKTVPKKYKCSNCGLERYTLPVDFCPDCGARKHFFEPIHVEMETIEPLEDVINKPSHYHHNGIDVIGFSELQFPNEELKGFYRINVLKYVTRYDRKNNVEDLKKASFYLNKLIDLEDHRG